ncbi:MAG TPA: PHB depolymerase family esterase [Verrucomicrobiae bacterium]|nr:PHB depolymerase family esterase [Verrucomicrobiae bacterium]
MHTPIVERTPAQTNRSLRRVSILFGAVLLIVLLFAIARRRAFGSLANAQTIEIDGTPREFLVHVPPGYVSSHRVPLVLVLHGATQSAANIEKMSGMDERADNDDFIAAYPEGTGRAPTWNAGACCGYAQNHQIDDVAFIRALIGHLEQAYSIDPKRVYVTGISNGAMMAYRLGCELSSEIAAIAPVEGAQDLPCHPSQPVSVIVFHGTSDRLVPFNGGSTPFQIGPHRTDTSVMDTVDFWVQRDGCLPAPTASQTSGVHISIYSGCIAGTGVALYAIQGGRHDWPGSAGADRLGLSGGVDATGVMCQFFAAHPKR